MGWRCELMRQICVEMKGVVKGGDGLVIGYVIDVVGIVVFWTEL